MKVSIREIKHGFLKNLSEQERNDHAVLFISFNYAQIENVYGVDAAERTKRRAGRIIENKLEADNEYISMYGDGYFMIVREPEDEVLYKRIDGMLANLRHTWKKAAKDYPIKLHAGAARLGYFKNDDEALLCAAELAKEAGARGQAYIECTEDIIKEANEKVSVTRDIRKAIENENIETYVQFLVDVKENKEVGGELLARWNHNRFGMLKPTIFVKILESWEMMREFDEYMIEKACQILEEWGAMGDIGASKFLSCNVSRHTAEEEDFPDFMRKLTEKYKFETKNLILELTEYSKERKRENLIRNVNAIKELGVGFFLDDYGSGCTSPMDWADFPLTAVKLDAALGRNINNEKVTFIAKNCVDTCHKLGYKIVFEGIENKQGVETIKSMGGDIVQGFYFYESMPTAEATKRLKTL